MSFLLFVPVVLISLSLHELAHGYAAYKMGDPTARNFGRLTLNPAKHLDPIGTVCMLIFGFGWAKPVPVNTRCFRNPRKGMAVTAVAGPLANLALSFVFTFLYHLFFKLLGGMVVSSNMVYYTIMAFLSFLSMMAYSNAILCVFNLIPIPPLDGSRILSLLLPAKWSYAVMQYERYIMIGFLALVFVLSRMGISLVSYPADGLVWLFDSLFSAIGL